MDGLEAFLAEHKKAVLITGAAAVVIFGVVLFLRHRAGTSGSTSAGSSDTPTQYLVPDDSDSGGDNDGGSGTEPAYDGPTSAQYARQTALLLKAETTLTKLQKEAKAAGEKKKKNPPAKKSNPPKKTKPKAPPKRPKPGHPTKAARGPDIAPRVTAAPARAATPTPARRSVSSRS